MTNRFCPRCQAALPDDATRCAACGFSADVAALPAPATPPVRPTSSGLRSAIDNPYAVLATVFFVTAAFGIPLIWMCRAWSTTTKWLLTLVSLAYTALLLWLFWLVMLWCWSRLAPIWG
jgi:hypothetical protein